MLWFRRPPYRPRRARASPGALHTRAATSEAVTLTFRGSPHDYQLRDHDLTIPAGAVRAGVGKEHCLAGGGVLARSRIIRSKPRAITIIGHLSLLRLRQKRPGWRSTRLRGNAIRTLNGLRSCHGRALPRKGWGDHTKRTGAPGKRKRAPAK
jgi:hypothetical protein